MEAACRGFVRGTSVFPPLRRFYSTGLQNNYAIVFHVVVLFFPNIPENVIMQHNVLPTHRPRDIKVYFIHLVFGLHLDEEILMVESGIYQQVRAFLDVVDLTCGRLNELIFRHSHFALFQQHPAMYAPAQIEIWVQLIRLIVVNC